VYDVIGRRWRRPIVTFVGLIVAYYMIPSGVGNNVSFFIGLIISAAALVLLAWGITGQVRRQFSGGSDVALQTLVVMIELVVVVFAYAFYLLENSRPGEVSGLQTRTDSLYFTLSTMTTVGFGDIHAAGQSARVLVMIQLFFNIVFVGAAATIMTDRIKERVAARRRASGDDDGSRPPAR
jgi:voltage-gated potassium channel